jgi:hypothetical protein
MKTSPRPPASIRRFILKTLIPFIRREQGRGFGMSDWIEKADAGEPVVFDEVERKVPVCGTIACIGGSIQHLSHNRVRAIRTLGAKIGLTANEANGLFYYWDMENPFCWPVSFRRRFAQAATTRAKAGVACALLKKIANEGGACLHNENA